MKRRDFIKKGMPLAVAPIIGTQAFASLVNPLDLSENTLSMLTFNPDRILVIINLAGGNDGLATIIRNNDDNLLNPIRSGISSYNDFNTHNGYKINPNIFQITQNAMMAGANCAIINGVGLATANPSHFCAQDVWQCGTGTYSESVSDSGWIGKFFNENQSIYGGNSPLAVQVGGSLPRAFMHSDFDKYYLLHPSYTGGNLRTAPLPIDCSKTNLNKELAFLRKAFENTNTFNTQIQDAYNSPNNNTLGNFYTIDPNDPIDSITQSFRTAMKTVARLIRGGLWAKIYTVTLNGFDTHSNQLINHDTLLKGLSTAITGFQNDMNVIIGGINLNEKVLGMTFSEFGRRVKSNGTGTDHGRSGPMFLFGKNVSSGILGQGGLTNINISQIDSSTNTELEYDYRTVYTAVIEKWFGASSTNIISPQTTQPTLVNNVKDLITI